MDVHQRRHDRRRPYVHAFRHRLGCGLAKDLHQQQHDRRDTRSKLGVPYNRGAGRRLDFINNSEVQGGYGIINSGGGYHAIYIGCQRRSLHNQQRRNSPAAVVGLAVLVEMAWLVPMAGIQQRKTQLTTLILCISSKFSRGRNYARMVGCRITVLCWRYDIHNRCASRWL